MQLIVEASANIHIVNKCNQLHLLLITINLCILDVKCIMITFNYILTTVKNLKGK